MAFVPHVALTVSGTLGDATAPVEDWAFRLNFGASSGTDLPAGAKYDQPAADAIWTAAAALITNGSCRFSTNVQLRQVKLSSIDANGRLVGNATVKAGTMVQGSGTNRFPPQVAWVASLMTGIRGGSNRGRIFLPGPAIDIDGATFLTSTLDRGNMEAQVVTFLRACQTAVAAPLVVASSKGFSTPVATVRMGRALDTMRSRRTKVPESYDLGTTL